MIVIRLLAFGGAGLLVIAVGAAVLGKLPLAARLARASVSVGGSVFLLAALVLVSIRFFPPAASILVPPDLQAHDVDPAERARAIAEGISRLMNAAALGAVVALLGGVTWWVARRRTRAGAR